jgi:hypothetical protein
LANGCNGLKTIIEKQGTGLKGKESKGVLKSKAESQEPKIQRQNKN